MAGSLVAPLVCRRRMCSCACMCVFFCLLYRCCVLDVLLLVSLLSRSRWEIGRLLLLLDCCWASRGQPVQQSSQVKATIHADATTHEEEENANEAAA